VKKEIWTKEKWEKHRVITWHGKERQGNARHDMARNAKARHGMARQGNTRKNITTLKTSIH
jgi:hypothetical protein